MQLRHTTFPQGAAYRWLDQPVKPHKPRDHFHSPSVSFFSMQYLHNSRTLSCNIFILIFLVWVLKKIVWYITLFCMHLSCIYLQITSSMLCETGMHWSFWCQQVHSILHPQTKCLMVSIVLFKLRNRGKKGNNWLTNQTKITNKGAKGKVKGSPQQFMQQLLRYFTIKNKVIRHIVWEQ